MNVIITMAGDGRRFTEAGYDKPKFAIEVKGRSLINWSLSSLTNFCEHNFIFVSRNEQQAGPSVSAACRNIGIKKYSVIELAESTTGQADTAARAVAEITSRSEPILIYNIDTYVEPRVLPQSLVHGAGWLPAFEAPGTHWSFVKCDSTGLVSEVAEKRPISNLATIGLYYFESFDLFEWSLRRCSFNGYKEKFVAPLYQELINDGKKVYTSILSGDAVHVLGTPAEIESFRASSAT